MKRENKRHGWHLALILAWFMTVTVLWAAEDSTTSVDRTNSPSPSNSVTAPPESAAAQKIYGVRKESAEVIEPKQVSLIEVMLRILGALLIVVAILLGGAWWFRKSRMFGLMPGQSSHLSVIETRSLGSRHALHVVEYGSKRFLIADSPAGTNFLTDLDKLNDSSEEVEESSVSFSPGSFAEKLKTLLERKG
tara:strand:+ start:1935 stop:2510 length:576 start_codon:yes stop_codon:yes gene_type:complete